MNTSGFGFGRSPFEEFDELMSRFFGEGGPATAAAAARRPQRVDIGSLLSERARELVAEARDMAGAEGSEELDARHLLAAATRHESTRRLLTEVGADPDRLREQLDSATGGGERTEPTTLIPSAKRALLDAYRISRAEGASCIGPGHLLRALAASQESAAGQALGDGGWEPTRLPTEGTAERKKPSSTPTVDEYGRVLTEDARDGRLDPVIGRDDEVEQTIEAFSRRSGPAPGAHPAPTARPGRLPRGHRRGRRSARGHRLPARLRRPSAAPHHPARGGRPPRRPAALRPTHPGRPRWTRRTAPW